MVKTEAGWDEANQVYLKALLVENCGRRVNVKPKNFGRPMIVQDTPPVSLILIYTDYASWHKGDWLVPSRFPSHQRESWSSQEKKLEDRLSYQNEIY